MFEFTAFIVNRTNNSQRKFYVLATSLNDAWSKAKQLQDDLYGDFRVVAVQHRLYTDTSQV